MPKRKTTEAETAVTPEPAKKRATRKPSTAVAHKHTTKKATKPVEEEVVAPAVTVEAPVAASKTDVPTVTHEQIAKLAYFFAEARGFQWGDPVEDWIRAERQLLDELNADR